MRLQTGGNRVAETLGRPDLLKPSCGGPHTPAAHQTAKTTMKPAVTIIPVLDNN